MTKIVRVSKSEDIAKIIQRIKNMREKEAIFEAEKGSVILTNSANLRLMRKTAEVLGKSITLKTDDPVGRVLATKAGMPVYGEDAQVPIRQTPRSMGLNKSGFSDIRGKRKVVRQDDEEPETFNERIQDLNKAITAPVKKVLSRLPIKKSQPMVTMPRPTMAGPKQPQRKWWAMRRDVSKIFVLTAVVLVIAIFGLAVLLPKAQITVYARSEPITRDMEITVDKSAQSRNTDAQIIPGEVVIKELSDTKTFQTTGTREIGEKATGSVVLYNFTKNTLTLRAATTTLVINGKNYAFTKDVTGLRPTGRIGSGEDQEVDRTSLIPPVPIVAAAPGEQYNLNANQKFEIRNAALGTTQDVYAMNEVAISGGTTKILKILSQADIDRATSQMTEELAANAEEELSNESDSSTKILPTGSTQEVLAQTANKNVGDEAEDFDMTIIGRITGLAYDEDEIVELMAEKINAVLTPDKYLMPEGKKEVTARFKSLDLSAGVGLLTVHFETVVAYKIDSEGLSKVLAGKTANEIKEILWTKPEIDKVDVRFSPFFVNKAPRYNGKIYINTVMSES